MVLQRNYSDSPSLFESPNFQMQLHNREMNTDDTNPTVIGAQYQSWKSCPARPTHASILLEVRDKTVLLEVGDKECHSHQ
jgi:hypothetical protein